MYLSPLTKKIHVGGIFCDMENVCDFLNHGILLAKLHLYEIRGLSVDWFRSGLTAARQKSGILVIN